MKPQKWPKPKRPDLGPRDLVVDLGSGIPSRDRVEVVEVLAQRRCLVYFPTSGSLLTVPDRMLR